MTRPSQPGFLEVALPASQNVPECPTLPSRQRPGCREPHQQLRRQPCNPRWGPHSLPPPPPESADHTPSFVSDVLGQMATDGTARGCRGVSGTDAWKKAGTPTRRGGSRGGRQTPPRSEHPLHRAARSRWGPHRSRGTPPKCNDAPTALGHSQAVG